MHRIDSAGTVNAIPTPSAVGATVGYFTEGNAGTGTPATVVSGDWANAIQEEVAKVIEQGPITLDKTARDQLWKAIKLMANRGAEKLVSSADYTVLDQDFYRTILFTTAASTRTLTLPTLADNQGRIITISKIDSGAGKLVVDGEGAETIEGVTDIEILSQHGSVTLFGGSTEWKIIGQVLADVVVINGSGAGTNIPVAGTVTSLGNVSVPKGKWKAEAQGTLGTSGAVTGFTSGAAGLSTANNTIPSDSTTSMSAYTSATPNTSNGDITLPIIGDEISLASATSYFLNLSCNASSPSNLAGYGRARFYRRSYVA